MCCILSKFYIKPQHLDRFQPLTFCCILSKFYIKPQRRCNVFNGCKVVSYRNSTSNHNQQYGHTLPAPVVSYRNSTSNHNGWRRIRLGTMVVSYRNSTSNHNEVVTVTRRIGVVSYRNSTSNHNRGKVGVVLLKLYLIEILHQTTTFQHVTRLLLGCILSKFYIKPQQFRRPCAYLCVVSYRNSTSNHNVGPHID